MKTIKTNNMKTINFSDYAYNAISESIKAIGISSENVATIVSYYGNSDECTFDDYFDAQIKDGNFYDATDVFDEENFIGSVEDNSFEIQFEDAREKAFKEWFVELVENVEEDELIDVLNEVEIAPKRTI